jgi:hypothetical protein
MHEAFPRSDYYETSAPPTALSRRRACPPGQAGRPSPMGDRRRFPRSPHDRSARSAPRYYPDSIATATPQAFTMASPPAAGTGFGVDRTPPGSTGHALHSGPDPPGSSRRKTYGALHGFLNVCLLALLAGPGTSGSAAPSRHCRGRFPPSPASPGSGCPQLHPGRCDDPAVKVSHPHSVTRRLVAHPAVLALQPRNKPGHALPHPSPPG